MAEITVLTYSLTEGDNGSQVSVVFSDGTTETVTDKHSNFELIKGVLNAKPNGYGPVVYDLVNVAKTVSRKFKNLSSRVTTDGTELYFDGDAIDSSLAQYILKLLREDSQKAAAFFNGENESDELSDVTWEALVKFLELLYSNPNPQSRESLYEFISRYGLTIRKDGHFIAYKGLQDDFGSINKGYGIVDGVEVNGTLYNKPGSVLRFPRKDVDSNTTVGCSQGLHAGTHAYATNWARGGKLVAVAINPMNVVSVPDDCTFQKIRVCEYEILNEVDPLESAEATSGWENSSSYWPSQEEWDDDYNGEDYEDLIDDLVEGDVVNFDYISVDGNAQHVDEAVIEEVGSDYLKAYVPSKDGYRTFKFNGISNIDYSSVDCCLSNDEDADDESCNSEQDTPTEESQPNTFGDLSSAFENLIHGSSAILKHRLSEVLSDARDLIPAEVQEKAKKLIDNSNINEVVDFDVDNLLEILGLKGTSEKEADTSEADASNDESTNITEGDVVSFTYTSEFGDTQEVSDVEVVEVQAEYFKGFVPAKDSYRTYRFDRISNLVAADSKDESAAVNEAVVAFQSKDEIKQIVANLRIGDTINVVLNIANRRIVLGWVKVMISGNNGVTIRDANGGYKSFDAEDVLMIKVI